MMLADISGLIGLIIFVVISVVAALLKRKEEPFEIPPELRPRRNQPNSEPPPVRRSWEDELRELLEQRPAPPPIVRETAPPPLPRPVRTFERVPEPMAEASEDAPHAVSGFQESDFRYAQASHLQERVAQHFVDMHRHRVGTTSVVRRESSVEARAVVNMLRHPQTVRRAVLASIILGPPRAFESGHA